MRINTQRGIAPLAALIIALLVIGGGAYGVKKVSDKKKEKQNAPVAEAGMPVPGTDAKETEVMGKAVTLQVKLDEQNKSGQSGQAVITQVGTSTLKVIVNITGKPSGVAQPAHIHIGSCPNPGAVKYLLTSIDKGASQTELSNLTIAQLLSELPLAVNVHKSAAEVKVYPSCGNIVKEEMMSEKRDNVKSSAQDTATPKKETKVTYTSAGFAPQTVTIKKGETIVFENKTGKAVSVASDEHPTHLLYPEFDQYKTAERGKDEFRFTFEKVGAWKYHDHLNATMTGTVIVE